MLYQLYEKYKRDNRWRSRGLFPNTKEAKEYAKKNCNPYSLTRIATYNPNKNKNLLDM